jgi:hypothetical protein
MKRAIAVAIFALGLALPPSAFAQQQQGGMSATDMQTMMNQCAQMRQQMQQNRGAAFSVNMQRVMAQCDQMSKVYGGQPNLGHHQEAPSIPQRMQEFPEDRGYGGLD